MSSLRLPKDLLSDPRHDEVQAILTKATTPLWERGQHPVPTVALTARLAAELDRSIRLGLAKPGLEGIAIELAREQKGLDALAEKSPATPQNPRISRVLFIASDAAERFYRECDTLLSRYSHRLLICRVAATGDELGLAVARRPKLLKAVLVVDKKAATRSLLALLP